jgi:hypothetical protein
MVCSPDKDRGRLALHPDLEAEQAYVDYAYECLEASRRRAASLGSMVEVGRGGTEQARFERDVIWDTIVGRLRDLELGDASLVFGRIDRAPVEDQEQGDTYYIGRLAVADEGQEPSRSIEQQGAPRWDSSAAGTSPPAVASCSASRTSSSVRPRIDSGRHRTARRSTAACSAR